MELLLVCLSTNVLVHLNEEEDELMRIIGTVCSVYLLKCTVSLAVPLETTHSQAKLSTCGRLLIVISIVVVIRANETEPTHMISKAEQCQERREQPDSYSLDFYAFLGLQNPRTSEFQPVQCIVMMINLISKFDN